MKANNATAHGAHDLERQRLRTRLLKQILENQSRREQLRRNAAAGGVMRDDLRPLTQPSAAQPSATQPTMSAQLHLVTPPATATEAG